MHSYFLLLLFGGVLVLVVVMVCLLPSVQQTIIRDHTGLLRGGHQYGSFGVELQAPRKETPSYSTSFPAGRRPWERGCFLLSLRTYACTFKSNSCFTSSQGSDSSYIWPSKQLTGVVFNQSVVKPELKLSLSPIAKRHNPMKSTNQSKLAGNTCNWRRARENACVRVAIGFGLT